MTTGSEGAEWGRQPMLEQEAERQPQKHAKDEVAQRRAKGTAKLVISTVCVLHLLSLRA